MTIQRVEFKGGRGDMLVGALELPPGRIRAAALFAHCFTCTKQSKAATEVTRALAAKGIATLRFDFTGLGGSEGDFGNGGFASDVDDVIAAADWLRAELDCDVLLIGHSLGGAAVLAAAQRVTGAIGVATIGAPADVPHVLGNVKGDLAAIETQGHGEVSIGGRPFRLRRAFLDAVRKADLLSAVKILRLPLLLLHAPRDEIVGIDNARKLFEAAIHPKSFVSLDEADHLLTDADEARYAAGVIAGWAARYLSKIETEAPAEGVMAETGHGKFGTQLWAGRHAFIADEPASYGGADMGPSPYDYLGAALASCTVMTLHLYAARKGIALHHAEVTVTHDRNHAEDCDHPEMPGEEIQALWKDIRLEGELSDDDRTALLEIADKCPVNKTLTGHLHIHRRESAGD